MRITINNLDGQGAVDYTAAVLESGRITLQRRLNAPTRCTATLLSGMWPGALPVPARLGRVTVTRDDATVLFTGYVTTEPVREAVGMGSEGPVYQAVMTAVSDEWLLDRNGSGAAGNAAEAGGAPALALDGAVLLGQLAARAGGALSTATAHLDRSVGWFAPRTGVPWSVNAGEAAGAAYAGYRALGGSMSVAGAGAVTHVLSDTPGSAGGSATLDVSALRVAAVRELANDITLTGRTEPAAYVQEHFAGDGTTTEFTLRERMFAAAPTTLIDDSFGGSATFNPGVWSVGDPGSHLGLTGAGLTMNGGNGADGVTTLTALDALEMGGTLLIALSGVSLAGGCDGMLAGLYSGTPVLANCFAGFRVRQVNAVTTLIAVVNGAETGTPCTVTAGQPYTLRLRLHCAEVQRVPAQYYCMVDGVVQSFGPAGGVDAAMDVVFELVDQAAASNTPATVLYDSAAASATAGAVAGTPATCVFVAANCTEMFGSVAGVRVQRTGTLWITSVLPNGTRQTRLIGAAGEGVDCEAGSIATGGGQAPKLTFFAGRVPVAGERLVAEYRSRRRSVARLENAASVAAEALGGAAGTSRWLGAVLHPAARSSSDCESAAAALLAFASARSAAVAGTYRLVNPAVDVWPGDVLQVTSAGVTTSLLVRAVTVTDGGAAPEALGYAIAFANDWATEYADGMGLALSEAVAADAVLPVTAASGPAAMLTGLSTVTVTSLSDSAVQLDAGMAPPPGGGFEVRRRDWAFGPANDADLVLRSPVRNFSFPRAAQVERYFVRLYDASTPPVYSRFSACVALNWPVG